MIQGSLVPAYGRDYKSKAAFLKDWNEGKDFSLQSYNGGGYCSIRDFANEAVGSSVQIRFNRLASVNVIRKAKDGTWK